MTFGYFNYLSHFVGGMLLSYSYFIFRVLLGQPEYFAYLILSARMDLLHSLAWNQIAIWD